ncbi:MAG: hypothetical protein CFH30_01031 [Alphaproteobacteria bacterium MarineAlpha8_Bin1]|nr:MAG: hypothetical protein CFH30_01031 [Alphaproteobacteria bacterium MarineAlpha8_Bin1]|tara:strand:- start:207 stop:461 length:255 start_codon:yes stop_codon:yes gene_type:complete
MNESTIYKKLNDYLSPSFLKVVNESDKHANHKGSPGTGNSHFYVEIQSKELTKISRLDGQRKIFKILEKEMKEGIHALSIKIIY